MKRIRLFTTAFPVDLPGRRAEYAECLLRNIGCDEIDEVCILAEGAPGLPVSAKLVRREIGQRPLYSDYFAWIREVAGPADVSIIANADIYFDNQVGALRSWQTPARTVIALARWDVRESGDASLVDRNDSQDAWIFVGAPARIFGDFPIGVPRCDNRIAKELELAGMRVINPAFSVRSYHLHAGQRDGYTVEQRTGFVDPPYGYVWPHNLGPLTRTLLHNAFDRDHRVGWRFDKRYWSGVLKLHWIGKGFSVLARPFRSDRARL